MSSHLPAGIASVAKLNRRVAEESKPIRSRAAPVPHTSSNWILARIGSNRIMPQQPTAVIYDLAAELAKRQPPQRAA